MKHTYGWPPILVQGKSICGCKLGVKMTLERDLWGLLFVALIFGAGYYVRGFVENLTKSRPENLIISQDVVAQTIDSINNPEVSTENKIWFSDGGKVYHTPKECHGLNGMSGRLALRSRPICLYCRERRQVKDR